MPFLSGAYSRTKTFADLGSLTPSDLNSIQEDIGAETKANATYKTIRQGGAVVFASVSDPRGLSMTFTQQTASINFTGLFYLNPADHPTVGTTALKLRLRVWSITGTGTLPGVSFAISVAPVVSFPAGSLIYGPNLNTVTLASPLNNQIQVFTGTDFPFPAAGFHAVTALPSSTTAVGSTTTLAFDLQVKQF